MNFLIAVLNYCSLWALARFATGIDWWASLFLLLGGPLALLTLVLSLFRRVQLLVAVLNGLLVIVYSYLWVKFIFLFR
jgi:hypothetical protein